MLYAVNYCRGRLKQILSWNRHTLPTWTLTQTGFWHFIHSSNWRWQAIGLFNVHGQYTEYTKTKHVIAFIPNGYCHFHFCFITSVPSRTKSLTSEDKNLQFKNSWTSGGNTSSSAGIKTQVFWGSYSPATNCNLLNTYQTDTTSKMTIDKQVYVQVHEKKDINLQEKWGGFPGALPGDGRSRTLNGGFIYTTGFSLKPVTLALSAVQTTASVLQSLK